MTRTNASAWYTVTPIGDDVTLISERHVREYYRCNIWHVRGRDRDMLVDSGMGVVSLREAVPLVTEKRCFAVASHGHYDHIGAHHEFEDRLAHAAEAGILGRPTRENTLAAAFATDEIFSAAPPEGWEAAEYAVRAAPVTRTIGEGDVIDLGNRAFEVLHLPGHSPGGIGLWEVASGVLFTGDTLYDGPLGEGLPGSDAAAWRRSMERLLELPARVVHGGHFPSHGGARHRRLIEDWLRANDARR